MVKFIALRDKVYLSIEINGDKIRFFGHLEGKTLADRKELTPDFQPKKKVLNEIIERPTLSDPMSEELTFFIDGLKCKYLSLA